MNHQETRNYRLYLGLNKAHQEEVGGGERRRCVRQRSEQIVEKRG